jgi:hypothetical protein
MTATRGDVRRVDNDGPRKIGADRFGERRIPASRLEQNP